MSPPKKIICPYCLAELHIYGKNPEVCGNTECERPLPVQYLARYEQNPPFFIQMFGWPKVGKTVYIYILTVMLTKMDKIWSNYTYAPLTEASKRKKMEINENLKHQGQPPEATRIGNDEVYIMLLEDMERWGGRTLVVRDYAGEIFEDMEIPPEQAPFLLNTPITFMFISLLDLKKDQGRAIDDLMNNYINVLMKRGVIFEKETRRLVIILTKADEIIKDMPINLQNYLKDDSLWPSVNAQGYIKQLDALAMEEYIEIMDRVSEAIHNWIFYHLEAGRNFIRRAEKLNIRLHFSLISSLGCSVGDDGKLEKALYPKRVLDPFFWALELQSQS